MMTMKMQVMMAKMMMMMMMNDDGRDYDDFLQWMGTAATQRALEGRLLLVNLLCKVALFNHDHIMPLLSWLS